MTVVLTVRGVVDHGEIYGRTDGDLRWIFTVRSGEGFQALEEGGD